ncbi:SIR2 family protein [Citrobacter koseri]|uniref:SIR2 family protein n=1 Tax=Citrobacter koseri TaxID=545 RepID=UPI0022307C38|nr:SIR2 family protein [Citrobacter koseri]MDM9064860.1 SIR2 family protein [Citrobacter koseri]MDM9081127.1 SIR2 family protein [Citrobacter koseri]MDM9091314.1 SIR2 family protein [Citrobacter koseri]MDM9093560.1 SIR2 family protein [Citrobacter koseri]MDM9267741.1 SIR2 family protein [Citrobacter koseri]
MFESIEPLDIYNKNINILIGSGASADLFPTLSLAIKDANGLQETIETLATKFETSIEKRTALFMHYYNSCIFPVQTFKPASVTSVEGKENLKNYDALLTTLLGLLDRRKDLNRKINIFTTNYDGCLSHTADSLLMKGSHDFVVNDGTSGFHRKHLHSKNFNTFQCQTGIFERSNYGIPQLNIIHLHGSVYWSKNGEKIEVNYRNDFNNLLTKKTIENLHSYSAFLDDKANKSEDIPELSFSKEQMDIFWGEYNKLPIVNPTKWKFHETVFEEHYYQMLRLLSYELEKPNAILITFGFSFADEHILRLIQRSLSNPQLHTFICCYSGDSVKSMREEFKLWKNVQVIGPPEDVKMDFTNFNRYVFSLKPEKYEPPIADLDEDLL